MDHSRSIQATSPVTSDSSHAVAASTRHTMSAVPKGAPSSGMPIQSIMISS